MMSEWFPEYSILIGLIVVVIFTIVRQRGQRKKKLEEERLEVMNFEKMSVNIPTHKQRFNMKRVLTYG
jgi:hypothetical protein